MNPNPNFLNPNPKSSYHKFLNWRHLQASRVIATHYIGCLAPICLQVMSCDLRRFIVSLSFCINLHLHLFASISFCCIFIESLGECCARAIGFYWCWIFIFLGFYRNHMEEVIKFFETHHEVATFPFSDHNCPLIQLIASFCQSAYSWLKEDIQNVVVVHCKAGMGRTRLMICSLLLFLKKTLTPKETRVVLQRWLLREECVSIKPLFTYAPTTLAATRDFWTLRYTTSLEDGSFVVQRRMYPVVFLLI